MALENWSSGSVVKSTTEPLRFSPLDDIRSLQFKIEKKSPDLFKSKLEEWPLQVTRVFRERDLKSGGRDITRFQVKKAIKDVSEAERWREVRPTHNRMFCSAIEVREITLTKYL